MKLEKKKEKFVEEWGRLGTCWGISKAMAHIHASLLFETEPLCTDDIMKKLNISRGCCNMNINELVKWELLKKVSIEGERKEFFVAEKDMWNILTRVIIMRKQEELAPLKLILDHLKSTPTESDSEQKEQEFNQTINEMKMFADKADSMLELLISTKGKLLTKGLKMMMR